MPWFIPMIVGAALTVGKMANDQANQNKEEGIKANDLQYSPWTKGSGDYPFKMGAAPDQAATLGSGAVATGSYMDQAMNRAQTAKNLTPVDANTQKFQDEKSQEELNKAWKEQHPDPAPQTPQQQGGGKDVLWYQNNGSETYGGGNPVFVNSADGQKYISGMNGNYGGYDPNRDGFNWSPYGKA